MPEKALGSGGQIGVYVSAEDGVNETWGEPLFPGLTYFPLGRCTAREYLDFGEFAGPLCRLFDGAMAFIQRIENKPPLDVFGVYMYPPAE